MKIWSHWSTKSNFRMGPPQWKSFLKELSLDYGGMTVVPYCWYQGKSLREAEPWKGLWSCLEGGETLWRVGRWRKPQECGGNCLAVDWRTNYQSRNMRLESFLVVKSIGCSSRQLEFSSWTPPGSWQLSVTQASWVLMSSSDLCRHCTHMVYIICMQTQQRSHMK